MGTEYDELADLRRKLEKSMQLVSDIVTLLELTASAEVVATVKGRIEVDNASN